VKTSKVKGFRKISKSCEWRVSEMEKGEKGIEKIWNNKRQIASQMKN
jgi:hypothetical protein